MQTITVYNGCSDIMDVAVVVSPSKSHGNFIGYSDIILDIVIIRAPIIQKDFDLLLPTEFHSLQYKFRYQLNSIRNLIIFMNIYV